jgi:predicted RNA binding protein YcfA (HicA-like mRNA interferase family)
MGVKVRDLVRLLESRGWQLRRVRGSHRQFRHAEKGVVITVAGHPGSDVPVGTLKAILRSAGLQGRAEER